MVDVSPFPGSLKFIANTRYASQCNFFINSVRTTHFGLKCLKIVGAKLGATFPWDIKNSQINIFSNLVLEKIWLCHIKQKY